MAFAPAPSPTAPTGRSFLSSSRVCRPCHRAAPSRAPPAAFPARRAVCAAALDPEAVSHATAHARHLADVLQTVATRGDIGPFTDIDLETAGLIGAITGASAVASLIILFIVFV